MRSTKRHTPSLIKAAALAVTALVAATEISAEEHHRALLVLTSTNDPAANSIIVFKLNPELSASLSFVDAFATGGKGGAGTNAGNVQFADGLGAVSNYGSNTVTQLVRHGDSVTVKDKIRLAPNCVKPDSVALTQDHLFVVGANCAESHEWPSGELEGAAVKLSDPSAAQIVAGRHWAAVTFTSGSVLQLVLAADGGLGGPIAAVMLPSSANNTPLGAAFWGDVLGFTPAHSPDSFAIVNKHRDVFPITGPTPPYPSNAPCWVAKGPGNVWYTGNSPGHAISIFFSDAEGGVFYKSVPLPGAPTDLAVSTDRKWLAVIYSTGSAAFVAVFSIDAYGGLVSAATSDSIGVTSFNGVAFSQ